MFGEKLITHRHEQILHLGVANTMANIRSEWWIPRLRSKVKKVINQCDTCKVFSTKPYGITTTAALRSFRTEDGRPFETTGVVFAGPLDYKITKKEQGKCRVLIFTCASSRAVHLEVTKSQTAEEFQRKTSSHHFRQRSSIQGYRKLDQEDTKEREAARSPGGVLPYITYIGMCRCEGYDFQAV